MIDEKILSKKEMKLNRINNPDTPYKIFVRFISRYKEFSDYGVTFSDTPAGENRISCNDVKHYVKEPYWGEDNPERFLAALEALKMFLMKEHVESRESLKRMGIEDSFYEKSFEPLKGFAILPFGEEFVEINKDVDESMGLRLSRACLEQSVDQEQNSGMGM